MFGSVRENVLGEMVKKAASGVRAHVLGVRSARQKACGLARGKGRLGALGIGRVKKRTFFEHSHWLPILAHSRAFFCDWPQKFNRLLEYLKLGRVVRPSPIQMQPYA